MSAPTRFEMRGCEGKVGYYLVMPAAGEKGDTHIFIFLPGGNWLIGIQDQWGRWVTTGLWYGNVPEVKFRGEEDYWTGAFHTLYGYINALLQREGL